MRVRLFLGRGSKIRKARGKNKKLALIAAAFLTPAALMAFVLACWRLAADLSLAQGFAIAQYNLGAMYANGDDVPTDYVRAYAWINLAATQKYQDAMENLGALGRQMTVEQKRQALKLSAELFAKIPKK